MKDEERMQKRREKSNKYQGNFVVLRRNAKTIRIHVESDLSYIRKHPFHMRRIQLDGHRIQRETTAQRNLYAGQWQPEKRQIVVIY